MSFRRPPGLGDPAPSISGTRLRILRRWESATAISGAYKPWSRRGSEPLLPLLGRMRHRPFHRRASAKLMTGTAKNRTTRKWIRLLQ